MFFISITSNNPLVSQSRSLGYLVMDSVRKFEELTFKQQLEQIDALRDENTKGLFEVIEMKNKRLTYNEARIEALLKHIEELNIEIVNLEFKLNQAQNAINE